MSSVAGCGLGIELFVHRKFPNIWIQIIAFFFFSRCAVHWLHKPHFTFKATATYSSWFFQTEAEDVLLITADRLDSCKKIRSDSWKCVFLLGLQPPADLRPQTLNCSKLLPKWFGQIDRQSDSAAFASANVSKFKRRGKKYWNGRFECVWVSVGKPSL